MLNVDCSGVPDSCRDLMVLCESALKKAATHSSARTDDQNLHRSLPYWLRSVIVSEGLPLSGLLVGAAEHTTTLSLKRIMARSISRSVRHAAFKR